MGFPADEIFASGPSAMYVTSLAFNWALAIAESAMIGRSQRILNLASVEHFTADSKLRGFLIDL